MDDRLNSKMKDVNRTGYDGKRFYTVKDRKRVAEGRK